MLQMHSMLRGMDSQIVTITRIGADIEKSRKLWRKILDIAQKDNALLK